MKHLLFYIAVAVALIATAVYLWARCFSAKPTSPAYTEGKGRGPESGFMDTSTAQSGVTPIKGNLELTARAGSYVDPWFGKRVAIVSSMPTGNPVRVQTKTIW